MFRKLVSLALAALLATLLAGLSACAADGPTDGTASATSSNPSGADASAGPAASEPPTKSPDKPIFRLETLPKIDGSTAAIPLAVLMLQRVSGISEAQAYERANFSKTTEAYTRLANPSEAVDLILVYEGAPNDQWLGNPLELEKHAVGRDALVFLTSKSNPVDGITSAQARDIYAGKITNWKQLGGKDEAIVAYQRPGDSGSQILMQKLVMGDTAMTDAPTELRIAEMGGLMDAIASYQSGGSALGYSVYYYAQNMYQNPDLKLLKIDGVAPSNQTISAGDYPFLNPFYAVVRANAAKDSPARQLLNWILSDAGARCVEDAGYVAAK